MQDDAMKEMDQERAEFEALVAAFSGTPRSLRLLRYIGDNYFSGTLTELCEFSIATEVFGRPKSQFNPAEDAIARAFTMDATRSMAAADSTDVPPNFITIISRAALPS